MAIDTAVSSVTQACGWPAIIRDLRVFKPSANGFKDGARSLAMS